MAMPALSPTMDTGNIASWSKAEGDALNPGDVIAEIETDKATVDFECQDSGYLAKILVPAGSTDIPVGKIVALMVDTKEQALAFKDLSVEEIMKQLDIGTPASPAVPAAAAPVSTPPVAEAPTPTPSAPASKPPVSTGDRISASPYAKKLAKEKGINLKELKGTGPGGRIIAADVLEFQPAADVVAEAAPESVFTTAVPVGDEGYYTDVPHTNMRKVIANRLTSSKQNVPHYYLTADINLDALMALRSKLNGEIGPENKLSVNDFLIKAAALACKKVPEVNSSWLEHGIRTYDYVDVAVAVAVPDGLITPIVKDAHTRGLTSIGSEVKSLVDKAKNKKLKPEEYQGGTFTISNLGMFGISQFSAIINPPQAAILAVGAAEKKIVPDTSEDAPFPFKQATTMSVTLSCDHRVIDGAVGAQWISTFRSYLEDPMTMLL